MEVTGLDVSILYDSIDRSIFLYGLGLTALLSVITVIGSVVLGVLFGWLMHRRVPVISHFLRGLSEFLRMTPPLLQLYIVFFGLGGVLLALGFTLDAFLVAAVVLSLYAASSNAVAFSLAADVAATGSRRLRFTPRDIHRAFMLCYAAVMGNSANIVKATGMASTLALPELVSRQHLDRGRQGQCRRDDEYSSDLLLHPGHHHRAAVPSVREEQGRRAMTAQETIDVLWVWSPYLAEGFVWNNRRLSGRHGDRHLRRDGARLAAGRRRLGHEARRRRGDDAGPQCADLRHAVLSRLHHPHRVRALRRRRDDTSLDQGGRSRWGLPLPAMYPTTRWSRYDT